MNHQYLLIEEVADIARTTVGTVRYWISSGKLRSVRPGRRRLVIASDLEVFMQQGDSWAEPKPRQ